MPELTAAAPSLAEDALHAIREHLQRIRFGSIAITVHEGKIVQLDITEKRRIGR
jgi:hypothetical protein